MRVGSRGFESSDACCFEQLDAFVSPLLKLSPSALRSRCLVLSRKRLDASLCILASAPDVSCSSDDMINLRFLGPRARNFGFAHASRAHLACFRELCGFPNSVWYGKAPDCEIRSNNGWTATCESS